MLSKKIDIFNDLYEYIGESSKKEVHEKGLWHRVFTCLVINEKKGTVLLQKKKPNQYSFERPDYVDISVGGHYQAGEKIENGVRELKEELGIEASLNDLVSLGIRQTSATLAPNYINNEFQHIFLFVENKNIDEYTLDKKELNGLIEISIKDGIDLINGDLQKIKASFLFFENEDKKIENINLIKSDFVPNYLKGDQFFLRLLVAANRYLNGDRKNLFW